ncbi:MAG: aspartyl-trna synthetase [Silicimonas sp.]|nr:aspartyl-trna synthetase [Silicimonas sp.]MBT8423778.1 aspartyl-trna synthetase [Silicimonas sp.]NNL72344.1 aspartyl-trna synthetase [Silicimonas sp.]
MKTTAFLATVLALVIGGHALAAERGAVTNLPIPRFVSLKADEGNARRGPSLSHRIDWVFTRRNMPLRVTGEYGHWRRVEDRDGQGGWIHYSLLSGVRHVIIEADLTPMRVKPDTEAPVNAYSEAGVVARLEDCSLDWCRIVADGSKGWVRKQALWGVRPEEIRD